MTSSSPGLLPVDGEQLAIRPIRRDDGERLVALFSHLSPQSRYRRYLSPKRGLTPAEVAYFSDIDHVHHEAIAAVDERDGAIVGVARYVGQGEGRSVAHIAVEVADELQGRGIGTALAQRTIERARANKFTLLTATTLWANVPARKLLRRLGFRVRASHGSELELELELGRHALREPVGAGAVTLRRS